MDSLNPLTNASLSTMWAISRYKDMNDFFATSRQMGFEKVELNHQVNSYMLSGVNLDHYRFSSVHEPCPADIPTKHLVERDWLISSIDEDKRILGVKEVRKSIGLARNLNASVVVIHCGSIPFTQNHEAKLRTLFKTGRVYSDEYQQVKDEFVHARQQLVETRLRAVVKSLEELINYASRLGVKLGLENRYHFMDIPSIDEMEKLLSLAGPDQLGFIYDVGHAQAMDRLGFYTHEEWLTRFSNRILGTHLHDVIGLTDHFAPGLGEMDFNMIAKYLPEGSFRTCELLPVNSHEQVENGLKVLAASGCVRYL